MTKIILSGCFGHMGKVITDCVAKRADCEIVAGVDIGDGTAAYPVFKSFSDVNVDADVIIDFSHPSVLNGLLEFAVAKKMPAVIATTGLSDEQVSKIHETAKEIPLFFSANMSIGISLISELAAKAARVLEGSFDIEIVEAHHNQKIDAASGTALLLANSISGALTENPHYEVDRHSKRETRDKTEIGIQGLRCGRIDGGHEINLAGL